MQMMENEIFKKISEALLSDYSSVYYVNAVTNEYYWYSVNPEFHSLSLEKGGDDFFKLYTKKISTYSAKISRKKIFWAS